MNEVDTTKLRLGGMALANGLLLHGPTHWAAAVRTDDDVIKAAVGPKPSVHVFDDVVGVRGLVRLGEALVVLPLVRKAIPEAKFAFEHPNVAVAAAASSTLVAAFRRRKPGFFGEVVGSVASLSPALLALRVGAVAQYHGVEHKVVAAYEQGTDNPQDAQKEHERCGSHLVPPMIGMNLIGAAVLQSTAQWRSENSEKVARVATAIIATSGAIEFFAWCERHPEARLTKLARKPGYLLQKTLGTREPTEQQLEVGRIALKALL